MNTIRVIDLVGKDIRGIRADVRGGKYDYMEPLVRTLIRAERKLESSRKGEPKTAWLYLYWKPEQHPDGGIDCGYSGWEEAYHNEQEQPPCVVVQARLEGEGR